MADIRLPPVQHVQSRHLGKAETVHSSLATCNRYWYSGLIFSQHLNIVRQRWFSKEQWLKSGNPMPQFNCCLQIQPAMACDQQINIFPSMALRFGNRVNSGNFSALPSYIHALLNGPHSSAVNFRSRGRRTALAKFETP